MEVTPIIEIIRLCRKIDEIARDVYMKFGDLCDDKLLSVFWKEMSKTEAKHVSFWARAEQVEALTSMPNLFEQPDEVISDLNKVLLRSQDLLRSCEEDFSISKAFTIAYRLEFYVLHPAFEMLFHLLGATVGDLNPEDTYEFHIDGFIAMWTKQVNVTPEVELLGETLQRLWKENKHLALQATRDELTGMLNRRGFFAISIQLAHLAQRTNSTVGVMMIDIDNFKSINDRLGHRAGDLVLKGSANLLKKTLRASDVVGRYGGDEFIVMLPEIRSTAMADLAEKLRRIVEENTLEGSRVTISVGFASDTLGNLVRDDFQRLFQKADAALFKAKGYGRNRVMEFLPDDAKPNNLPQVEQ